MLNEGTQQRLIPGDAKGCQLCLHEEFREFGGRKVGQRVGLGVAPDQLDGIEFWGVRRQQVGPHTAASGKPGADRAPVVGLQPIPDKFDRCAHGARQRLYKGEDRRAVVIGIGQKTEIRAHPTPAWRNHECADYRDLAPRAAPLHQHRGLSTGRPGATYERRHQEARFVDEDEGRVPMRGVFFTRGQSSLIQRAMAASSRSTARRVGFCGLQPRAWSTRPT